MLSSVIDKEMKKINQDSRVIFNNRLETKVKVLWTWMKVSKRTIKDQTKKNQIKS